MFRKAGQALQGFGQQIADFDAAYANAADNRKGDYFMQMGHNQPLSKFFNNEPDTQLAKDHGMKGLGPMVYGPDASMLTKVGTQAANVGIAAANVASRYALPAGGAVLAAKGIADLATGNAFGGAADQPEPSQLRM